MLTNAILGPRSQIVGNVSIVKDWSYVHRHESESFSPKLMSLKQYVMVNL